MTSTMTNTLTSKKDQQHRNNCSLHTSETKWRQNRSSDTPARQH
jgi:hypothetical protein